MGVHFGGELSHPQFQQNCPGDGAEFSTAATRAARSRNRTQRVKPGSFDLITGHKRHSAEAMTEHRPEVADVFRRYEKDLFRSSSSSLWLLRAMGTCRQSSAKTRLRSDSRLPHGRARCGLNRALINA